MNTFRLYSNNEGFVMLDGTLQEVTLVKVVFSRHGDNFTSTTFFSTWSGGYSEQTNNLRVYSSVSDYEKGKEMPFELVGEDVIKNRRPKGFEGNDFGWIFINGEPQMISLEPDEIVYLYATGTYQCPDHVTKNGNVYKSREECLSFNTYDVKDAFGTITKRKGAGKLLMLDEDQKQLLKKFEDAFKALRKSGVSFFWSCDYTQVFNTRNIDDFVFDDVNEEHDDFEKVEILNDAFDCEVKCGVDLYPMGEDYTIFVKRKD